MPTVTLGSLIHPGMSNLAGKRIGVGDTVIVGGIVLVGREGRVDEGSGATVIDVLCDPEQAVTR